MVLFDPRDKEFREFKENQVIEDEVKGHRIVSFVVNV